MTRRGDTLLFDAPPTVAAWAAAGGKKESEGPLASAFDFVTQDAAFGEQGCENWEQAESLLQRKAVELCLRKADIPRSKVDIAFAGDLQAQCTASNYTMRELGIPFAGVYGACSTMAQGLALGGVLVEAGAAARLAVSASSHFCSAERQYRFPLAYGGQRTPTAQWTATAAGAAVLGAEGGSSVRMTHVLFGKMIELGVKDANNMGAAMAPEDVNLDPYIFGTLSAVFCMQSDVIRTHPRSFLSDRPETENRQSHLIPYLASSGILSAQMFFLSKHRR